jgi:hypothetical protein
MDSRINQKFGRLTILNFTGKTNSSRSKIYLCQCDCGNQKEIAITKLKHKTKSCGCLKSENLNHESGKQSLRFMGHGDISKTFWNRILYSAKNRKKEFNITIEYAWELFLNQNKKCAISGLDLVISPSSKDMYNKSISASLDRIDSTKGYIGGNVQWVHKDINYMKWKLSVDRFKELCKIVTDNDINVSRLESSNREK